jgi:hypothetical protein
MAQNFYKSGGSYYEAGTNKKILNPTSLQSYAQAGGKEINAPAPAQGSVAIPNAGVVKDYNVKGQVGGTLYGIPKITTPSITDAKLGTANAGEKPPAQISDVLTKTYAQQATQDSQLKQAELGQYKTDLETANKSLADLQTKIADQEKLRTTNIAEYNTQSQPFQMAYEIQQRDKFKVEEDYNTKREIASEITTLARQAEGDINTMSNIPSVQSVWEGRMRETIQANTARISLLQAADAAVSGNIGTAETLIDRGINAQVADRTDRMNYLKWVDNIYSSNLTDLKIEKDKETTNKQTAIKSQITMLENEVKTIQDNKDFMVKVLSDSDEARIAAKAGIKITDTQEQWATKRAAFLAKNPQYDPVSRKQVSDLMTKYPDAGITPNDTIQQAMAKLQNSRIYQNEVKMTPSVSDQIKAINAGYTVGSDGKLSLDTSKASADQVASAIKQVESGGNYNAKGGSGEVGAYQFMPGTWENLVVQYARANNIDLMSNPITMTPENQDMIAKWSIQQMLNDGYTPQQVAAKWNSGSATGWEAKVGTNSKGVKYNVPAYVNKVMGALTNVVKQSGGSSDDTAVSAWVQAVMSGNSTMASVPKELKNKVAIALDSTDSASYSPLAASRFSMASNRIVSNFIDLPQYKLTANGLPYLQRIDAAIQNPGSVSDQDLLDSLTKLNTAGNAITDAQVRLITDGKSFADMAGTFANKFKNGGVLSDNQRQQIVQIANAIYANYQKGYQPVYNQAKKQLEDAGIPKAFWTIPDLNNLSSMTNGIGSEEYPTGTIVQSADGKQYKSIGNNQFEEVK